MKGGGNNNKKCLSCMNVKIQEKKNQKHTVFFCVGKG